MSEFEKNLKERWDRWIDRSWKLEDTKLLIRTLVMKKGAGPYDFLSTVYNCPILDIAYDKAPSKMDLEKVGLIEVVGGYKHVVPPEVVAWALSDE